ncbi:cysteine-rich secretory protein family domain-containing protein [Ditylenchus destructor]|uniref:Cysteine-rich secretory protein family domain-containing protein n=1 Tax=Ditylenchus destructor TaxID=166010 RepID=A0AAD4MFB6_9BILA|nr:cysteine-rich secretory protein family domain-containing protein [Ditylenchus destructor]
MRMSPLLLLVLVFIDDFDARLSKKERHTVLNAHNHYRRILAKGVSRSNDGETLPEAANMFKMKYSRKIEHVAQKWASKCTGKHSYNPKYGENIAQFWPYANKKKVLKESAHNWWAELKKFGMNRNLKFTETLDNGNTWEDIGHWSQMAWAKTIKIGCGVAKCPGNPNSAFVVCNYSPKKKLKRQAYVLAIAFDLISSIVGSMNRDCQRKKEMKRGSVVLPTACFFSPFL